MFFFAAHEVDVELGDAGLAEAVEFFTVSGDGADEAEAVHNFVGDEVGVVAADFAVMVVVVLAAILDEGSERGRKFFRLVLRNQIQDMIGNERGKPADAFAGELEVVGGPDGRGGHDFDFGEVAAGFLGALANEAEAPFDEIGIGELENDAVADAARGAESFGTVAGDPDARGLAIGPGKMRGDAVEVNSFAFVESAESADKFLKSFEGGGFFAEDATGAVPAADAELHAAAGKLIQRGEEAGGNGDVADGGIGDAGAEMHFFGVGGDERQERKRLHPDDVRVEDPAVGEAGGFGLAAEREDAVNRDVGFDGDAEVHKSLTGKQVDSRQLTAHSAEKSGEKKRGKRRDAERAERRKGKAGAALCSA